MNIQLTNYTALEVSDPSKYTNFENYPYGHSSFIIHLYFLYPRLYRTTVFLLRNIYMLVCSTRVSFNKAMEKKKQLRVTHRSNIIRDAWKLSMNVHRSRITRTRHVSHAHDCTRSINLHAMPPEPTDQRGEPLETLGAQAMQFLSYDDPTTWDIPWYGIQSSQRPWIDLDD